ncbi:ferritin family protein [Candidatus Aciduliprofundum boonei]|uniref:Rubrerythrin n=1 Tax=Aciduliprofundum boonei (strain DSM 19572 / T469) TaxID=439481 RepID=D3TCI4_ACIB4|nr:ferritin family protein [Candidatus Aciduliprofundum boonei]ADD08269.1 Rubrerythrin [Aciduliprofundum boonei T469]HII55033.1 ferritin family protein [Candidatus Aciduliprofundum boonei]
MDVSKYSLEDLILLGIKSEEVAKEVYSKVAEEAKNPFLKTRLEALAKEEDRHREILVELYKDLFNGKEPKPPENPDFIPEFPEISIFKELGGTTDIRKILEGAMRAELSAKDYYESIAEKMKDTRVKTIMKYMAKIEEGHYKILKQQYEEIIEFESVMYDEEFMQVDSRF